MSATSFTSEAGRTQFLQLFVTQLQHQDPLEPVKQEQFLQQLAQFSTVEGLENLNRKFDRLIELQEGQSGSSLPPAQALTQGASLLGRQVAFSQGAAGQQSAGQGIVTDVHQRQGQILLQIGDQLIPVADVTQISTGA